MKEIFGSALLWPAEQLLNSVIRSDQHAQNQLARFAGRAIEIQILHSPLSLTATMETDGIRLGAADAARYAIPVDATVKGSASTLTRLLLSEHTNQPLVNSNLQITGDAQLVQDLFT
ncbi:MAG: SCP2 sterol-binding domain-containing protein, partial [Pseudomonadales bacterium]|nr:SCP2 sterol-binding domain-containing protein [Pseudomonadales bacterium]